MKSYLWGALAAVGLFVGFAAWFQMTPSSAAQADSGSVTAENEVDYQQWPVVSEQKVGLPLAKPTALPLTAKGAFMKTYVENPDDQESRWVEEVALGNRVFLRTTVGRGAADYNDPRMYQVLVDGKWLTGKPGVMPKIYLLDYAALFEKDEMKGFRLTLELADGSTAETTLTL